VAERSKARVCDQSLVGVAGSYPVGEYMLMSCVVSKDRMQDTQHKERSTEYKRIQAKFPVGARFSASTQIGPGAHPASYTKGTGSLSRG
jgi:hypothetical protein